MQKQSTCLLPSDQALLTNILGAYRKTYMLSNGSEYPSFPRVEHSFLHTFFNEYEERYRTFLNFMKVIPQFGQLSIDDKKHLVQNQYVETVILNNQIISKFISKALVNSLNNVYDFTSGSKSNQAVARLIAYMHDPLLLKLVIIIQTFSNGFKRYRNNQPVDWLYDDPKGIFAAQNMYVEILWRYLLSRLPSERDTVKFFNQLLLDLLFLQEAAVVVERYINNLPHEVNQMNELTRNLWLV